MHTLRQHGPEALAWACLALLLAAAGPLFLCLPPWGDVTLYDLAARNLLQGGVAYRDVFDTNLPGMVWLHVAVRSLLGWSSEALRAVDLVLVAGVIALLVRWPSEDPNRAVRAWTAFALAAFYLGTTERCHCQRDVWMLLPALAALALRCRQVERLLAAVPPPGVQLLGPAVLEGLCWGAAIWIKPFVLLPALGCWLLGAAWTRTRLRATAADAAGLLAGGLLAGTAGVAWLVGTGAWPPFWEVLTDWDREYLAQPVPAAVRTIVLFEVFPPWSYLHLLALPGALVLLGRTLRPGSEAPARAQALLAALYLGWLVQAAYVQRPFNYTLLPPVLLAIALVAQLLGPLACRHRALGVVLAAGLVVLAVGNPLLEPARLQLWGRCWREGSSPALRDHLSLGANDNSPDWQDLARAAEYLRGLPLRDGELTCYNNSTAALYLDLGLRPSTRYLHYNTLLLNFPSRREVIRRALAESPQRYVVSDLQGLGLTPAEAAAGADAATPALAPAVPEANRRCFPWNEPVDFRAGRFLVHRVTGPVRRLLPEGGRATRAPAREP